MKKKEKERHFSRPLFRMHYLFLTLVLCSLPIEIAAQSGGAYEIDKSVVAGGGGQSTGGPFSVTGTTGQTVVNSSTGSSYSVRSGFWQGNIGPTAALVSVGGRVTTAFGSGIRNVRVSLTDQTGVVQTSLTGAFGYFRFEDIAAGQTVVVSIAAKRHLFANPTRVVNVQEELADIDFTAEPQ